MCVWNQHFKVVLLTLVLSQLSYAKYVNLQKPLNYHPIPPPKGRVAGVPVPPEYVSEHERAVLEKEPNFWGVSPQYEPSEIVGGEAAKSDIRNKVVLISVKTVTKTVRCSGIILLDYLVLTAAHCFTNINGRYEVLSVTVTTGPILKRGKLYNVAYVDAFNDYNGYNKLGNIALVWIYGTFRNFEPLSFPDSDPAAGSLAFVAGYGATESSRSSKRLLEVSQRVQRLSDCRSKWPGPIRSAFLPDGKVVCATDPGFPTTATTGACSGDSGGPLFRRENGAVILIGTSSWGSAECTGPGATSFFVSIAFYFKFIQNYVWQDYTAWQQIFNDVTP